MWKTYNLAKTFGKLPGEVLFLKESGQIGDWEIYQLNSAVLAFGRVVEDELDEARRKASKGKKVDPGRVKAAVRNRLHKLLYPQATPTFAPLGNRAKIVKLEPGQDPIELLFK